MPSGVGGALEGGRRTGVVLHEKSRLMSPRNGVASRPTSIPVLYPMHLISVSDFLELDRLHPHQELKRQGKLVERTLAHDGQILFISHQWLGWVDPDPTAEQLKVIQRVLLRLKAGDLGDVEADWISQLVLGDKSKLNAAELAAAIPQAFVWMDYISMPQANFSGPMGRELDELSDAAAARMCVESSADAIKSIPAYVEYSTIILVVAPPCLHSNSREADGTPALCNFQSWRSRGWCRVEYGAALLARQQVPILVVQGENYTPELMFPVDTLLLPAGEGHYTCCSRNHDFGYGPVLCASRCATLCMAHA